MGKIFHTRVLGSRLNLTLGGVAVLVSLTSFGFAFAALAPRPAQADSSDPAFESWFSGQANRSARSLLDNIESSGAVVASRASNADYGYHWVRDGALTMNTVFDLYQRSKSQSMRARLLKTMLAYADFSRGNQLTPNWSGEADGNGVGEPKFNLNGSAIQKEWGRPQNDGPALRASMLIRLANTLVDQGEMALVSQKFYSSSIPARTVIKVDLEYIAHHWTDSSFDLWEEERGTHFYTRMVQRRALIDGAELANRLGDSGAASFYLSQAQAIEGALQRHWDGSRKLIVATLDHVGGLGGKGGIDVAVVLAALHGADHSGYSQDPFFAVTDERMLFTAAQIDDAFHALYPINAQNRTSDGRWLGTAIGRYPEDVYSGGGDSRGNPWFLATAAFAEYYYRVAVALESRGSVTLTSLSAPAYRRLVPALSDLRAGQRLDAGRDPRFAALIQGLREAGDSYLRRIRQHGGADGSLSEQFNLSTGYMQSAGELTWSHASLVTATWARVAR